MKVQLGKSLRHKGEELNELDIPLEDLTGADLIDVEQQMVRAGKVVVVEESSKVYLIRVAARAARIPVEVLEQLSARDFTRVTNRVQNFLMGLDSGIVEMEETGKTPEPDPVTSYAALPSD